MLSLKRKKRIVLTGLLIFLAVFTIWLYWGNVSVQTTEIAIHHQEMPDAFRGFQIAQVSDLHNAQFGSRQKDLLSRLQAASPDLIAVTGDLIDSSHTNLTAALDFIRGAADIAPLYFVTGNHEAWIENYEAMEQQLIQAGAIPLRDTGIELKRGDASIFLLGMDDPAFDGGMKAADNMDKKIKAQNIGESDFTVLLSHRPELFEVYVSNQMDLVLSGHAHGGQFRLPWIGGIIAPNQGFFPRYTAGVYEKERTKMLVSRGLGNSVIPVRFNNRPELIILTLD